MFNLNEDNRIVMAQHPSDMRIGVNGMCGQVRKAGLDPTNGDVYISCFGKRQIRLCLWAGKDNLPSQSLPLRISLRVAEQLPV